LVIPDIKYMQDSMIKEMLKTKLESIFNVNSRMLRSNKHEGRKIINHNNYNTHNLKLNQS